MDYTIRQATQADYPGLCELFAEVDIYHSQAVPHVFRPTDGPARTPEYIADILANENSRLFVAESAGQVIGFIQVDIREAPVHPIMTPRRYAKVDSLVVGKDFRRSGIGQSLMKRVHQWACERGVHEVELNVWEFNQGAIALYEKLGYKTAVRRMWTTL
jgi:ribosomal protein S18 acetylase RimI-like enzyme